MTTQYLTKETQEALYRSIADSLIEHADELTALDQAIGDGDHGINMKRGFDAVLAELPSIAALEPAEALKKLGMTLVMKVGGASGPLYGTLFMELGKHVNDSVDFPAFGVALDHAIAGVKKRGKSDVGAKTLLDVLVPVAAAINAGDEPDAVMATADAAAKATVDMLATRGRASFLKERSVGHLDPGARSSQLVVHCVCRFYGASSEVAA